jgi:YD repeat-containing protein
MKRIFLSALLAMIVGVSALHAATIIQYTYDDAGRLTQADYGEGQGIDYVYDANGNLLQRTVTGSGAVTYTLIYRAGAGGRIDGVATQQVVAGQSGTGVQAVAEDAGAAFRVWSDGHGTATRTDANVQAHLTVEAAFQSAGGADLDWYTVRGITPAPGEDWSDVDAKIVPGKGTTYRHENVADTDPTDITDIFQVLAVEPGPPPVITYRPSSPVRVYTLQSSDNLVDGEWTPVVGADHIPGAGQGAARQDSIADENANPARPYYRVEVDLP